MLKVSEVARAADALSGEVARRGRDAEGTGRVLLEI